MTLCFLPAASLAQNDLPSIFCPWQTSSSLKPLKNELFLLLDPSIKLILLLFNTYFTLSQNICICLSSLAFKALERLSPVNTCKPLCGSTSVCHMVNEHEAYAEMKLASVGWARNLTATHKATSLKKKYWFSNNWLTGLFIILLSSIIISGSL